MGARKCLPGGVSLKDKVQGLAFNSTTFNTGLREGAGVPSENEIATEGRHLIWEPYCHCIFKVMLTDVFKEAPDSSCSLNVELFERF